jgi:hypothetical protein
MAPLPYWQRATIDLRKLRDYCLDPAHPHGRHRARVFREALGIGQENAEWLRGAILEELPSQEAVLVGSDAFGERWRVDVFLSRQEGEAVIRTIWISRSDETAPRLVTCWVL